ncbi:MAG: L-2-hydroxyglutarate oxidase, partial [Alphaproteobacteria bacterium]
MSGRTYDFLIVGAGIVGAALAAEILSRRPGSRLLLVDKEATPAFHQTGRNSGVVHSGVYYKPGSLKARFCREGLELTRAFCKARNIRYETRGKLLVATNDQEQFRLAALAERAAENGVMAEALDARALRLLEPEVAGKAALRIPATAIVDYVGITRTLLADVERAGGEIRFNAAVSAITVGAGVSRVTVGGQMIEAGRVVACAGLTSDRFARLAGIDPEIRIVPFRGEYFVLPPALNTVVHHLIYPVPDPTLPFLGVHLTPMIDGTITVGPNAVLALAREKYDRFSFDLADAADALGYPGLWRMMARHPRATFEEMRGWLSRRVYLAAVQKYCPRIRLSDMRTYRSANRAQAVRPDGQLIDDFLIRTEGGIT